MRTEFAFAATVLLAACSTHRPAPVEFRSGDAGAAHASSAKPLQFPQSPPPQWEGSGTPLSAYALKPEEAHPFDPRATPPSYIVQPAETLFDISEKFQIPLRSIIETNGLDAPFTLTPGQKLKLPPPRLHVVRKGETLLSLARRYSIDARSLALLNRLPAPYAVNVGDTLVLPALARAAPAPQLTPAPAPVKASPSPASPRTATQATAFAWPVHGPVLAKFGPLPGGKRSDGVDIGGAPGAPIRAAADGRVVYAGSDLPGYGPLVLIQHDGGWVTAYAHCGALAVAEGARVKKGQKIAEVGRSTSGEAKVHFQTRRGAEPTDPLALLPKA
jgi:lipoprotein NlpD